MMASRQARQTAALVALLQALPEEQLVEVLEGLGIEDEKRAAAIKKPPGRCHICGQTWFGHKRLADRPEDGHPWDGGGREAAPSPGLHRPTHVDVEGVNGAMVRNLVCKQDGEAWPCEEYRAAEALAQDEPEPWDPARETGWPKPYGGRT